jgi:hypothetical protein
MKVFYFNCISPYYLLCIKSLFAASLPNFIDTDTCTLFIYFKHLKFYKQTCLKFQKFELQIIENYYNKINSLK